MIKPIEQERREREEIQKRMIAVAHRMLASKRQLQQEIREDLNKPEFRAAIDQLKKHNAERNEEL